ncbi:hypothetical protein LY78DRAFT_546129, partial [Colletotrichum sublineola]
LLMVAVAMAQIPPPSEAWICRLRGVVRDGDELMGIRFVWIDTKGVLLKARADQSSTHLRKR